MNDTTTCRICPSVRPLLTVGLSASKLQERGPILVKLGVINVNWTW